MINISYTIPTAEETRANVKDHKDLDKAISKIVEDIAEESSKGGYYTFYRSSDQNLLYQLERIFKTKGYGISLQRCSPNLVTHTLVISWED